jgi:hypothetical protein
LDAGVKGQRQRSGHSERVQSEEAGHLFEGVIMFFRFELLDDSETVEREMSRPDGMIRVRLRPFRERLWNSYVNYRRLGFGRMASFLAAWHVANAF